MIKKLLFLFFFSTLGVKAQCDCDVTLTGLSSSTLNLVWASNVNYSPGDTVCIPTGNYAGIRFYDFEGTAENPITFINCGGQVILNETAYSALEFKNSKYVHLTGSGDIGHDYGIKIEGTASWAMGIVLSAFTTDVEVDHIEVASAGFAGLMAKTDPDCNNTATWRSNGFVMKNLNIHHNYIHNTGGEGIYIGYTLGYKLDSGKDCSGTQVYGHWLENVDVHNNVIENTGWDAVQVNLAHSNGKVRDNVILDYGTQGRWGQSFAISLGGGTYEVYNNYVENGPMETGWGMQIINGESGSKVYNNVFVKPKMHGVFLHNRHEFEDVTEGYYVANNTIIKPERAGVHYNTTVLHPVDSVDLRRNQSEVPSYFVNNLVVDPGYDFEGGNTWKQNQESYFDFNERVTRDSLLNNIYSNVMTRQIDTLNLTDTVNNYYSPADEYSSLVDRGADVSSWGINFDFNGETRPRGNGFDIGAYELQYDITVPEPDPNDAIVLFPNPSITHFTLTNEHFKNMAKLKLTSLSNGSVVYDGKYKIGTEFNVEQYDSGLYVITLWSRGKVYTKQLLIQ